VQGSAGHGEEVHCLRWAPFEFTRINIEPIIPRKKIEDLRQVGTFRFREHVCRLVPENQIVGHRPAYRGRLCEGRSIAPDLLRREVCEMRPSQGSFAGRGRVP
jgi:hypothetical protein